MQILEKEDLMVKKIGIAFVGKSSKYPKNGPQLDAGEKIKFEKFKAEFIKEKIDMVFTNEILFNIKLDPVQALGIIKENYLRQNGFNTANCYSKIPRDVVRVGVLYLCSMINKELATGDKNCAQIMTYLLSIYEGLKLLQHDDPHRI